MGFLSSKEAYKRNRKLAYSTVGTPDYIAPEVGFSMIQNRFLENKDTLKLQIGGR
jgi:hypothetical protein